jgi:hypothetical protein|nr:MAG TPA: hypothetical protein [Caudoviricetes sp.]
MIKDLFEEVEVDKLLKDNAPIIKKIVGGEVKDKKPPKQDMKEANELRIPAKAVPANASAALKDISLPQKVQELISVFLREGFKVGKSNDGLIELTRSTPNEKQMIYIDYRNFEKDSSVDVYSAKEKRWVKFFLVGTMKLLWFAVIAALSGYGIYKKDKRERDAGKPNTGFANYVDGLMNKVFAS